MSIFEQLNFPKSDAKTLRSLTKDEVIVCETFGHRDETRIHQTVMRAGGTVVTKRFIADKPYNCGNPDRLIIIGCLTPMSPKKKRKKGRKNPPK